MATRQRIVTAVIAAGLLAVAYLTMGFFFSLPGSCALYQAQGRIRCTQRIKHVSQLTKAGSPISRELLTCPVTGQPYVLFAPLMQRGEVPAADHVLAFEPPSPEHGIPLRGVVVYQDGHTTWLREAAFNSALAASGIP
jgi:hypothetical protein